MAQRFWDFFSLYALLSATAITAKKEKGRELNAPPTEGTAKRPYSRIRQAAPDWARDLRLASGIGLVNDDRQRAGTGDSRCRHGKGRGVKTIGGCDNRGDNPEAGS